MLACHGGLLARLRRSTRRATRRPQLKRISLGHPMGARSTVVTESQIPPTWGKDKLADFCERCRHNTIGTFINAEDRYRRLKLVDEYYWILMEFAPMVASLQSRG